MRERPFSFRIDFLRQVMFIEILILGIQPPENRCRVPARTGVHRIISGRNTSRLSAIDREQRVTAVLLGDRVVVDVRDPERFTDRAVRSRADTEHE